MFSWHTPTPTNHFTSTPMLPTTKWAPLSSNKKSVAYWSCMLTKLQCNYHTTEKELLSIVMVLEEFCSMLLDTVLFIYTDKKTCVFMQKNMDLPSSITMARKMSLPIHIHSSDVMMCCRFQLGRMPLLSSLTSILKALISAMTLICLSASSTYHYPMFLRTTLLTLSGYSSTEHRYQAFCKSFQVP